MQLLQYILLGIVGLLGIYIIFRLISLAVLNSWFDFKRKEKINESTRNGT